MYLVYIISVAKKYTIIMQCGFVLHYTNLGTILNDLVRTENNNFITYLVTGPVKLIKDSIASSPRLKRNARKRSFEQSLSATAAKIHKLEQDRKASEFEQVPTVTEVSGTPLLRCWHLSANCDCTQLSLHTHI